MPEVAFYVLSSEDEQQRLLFVCRLVEKAYRSGSFCYVLTESEEQARTLDDLLWTFRQGSFIPHELYSSRVPKQYDRFLIGALQPPDAWRKVIVNLSLQGPDNFEAGERILEILDANEPTKAAGRQRFRRYQQAGVEPATHNM